MYVNFYLHQKVVSDSFEGLINSDQRIIFWTKMIDRLYFEGLSKFAKLARSVTRSKATFSSTLISSTAPNKSLLNVSEVRSSNMLVIRT